MNNNFRHQIRLVEQPLVQRVVDYYNSFRHQIHLVEQPLVQREVDYRNNLGSLVQREVWPEEKMLQEWELLQEQEGLQPLVNRLGQRKEQRLGQNVKEQYSQARQ